MSISIRTLVAGAAISLAIHTAPAHAQHAIFSEVRDAVPARSFDPATTVPLTDPALTTVPVSLTAQLFAFAAPALASAEVDLTRATIVVTVSPSTASPRE